jgi:hypothetical protein
MKKRLLFFRLINSIIPAAHLSGSPLTALTDLSYQSSYRFNMVMYSLRRRLIVTRPMAYIICNFLQDITLGMKFGQLALPDCLQTGC